MITKKEIKETLKGYSSKRTKQEIIDAIHELINLAIKNPQGSECSLSSIITLLWSAGMDDLEAYRTAMRLYDEAKKK